jgi:hypothetical protein
MLIPDFVKDFQLNKYPKISCGMGHIARPSKWAGGDARPTIRDNLIFGSAESWKIDIRPRPHMCI